jgi:hypothetical protein
MKEALQEQQSYGLKLKSMLDAGRFSAERRAGRYAEELKMIKQQHFLSTYPFQLEEQLENILHKARAMSAQYVMSAWHAATAESRNKLDVRKLTQNVSMKRSCVNIWSRAALHAARRTHASQKIQRLSTVSKLARSFWCFKRTMHLQNSWFKVVAKSLTPLQHVCFVGRAHIAHRHWLTAMVEHACDRKSADAREKKRSSDAPEEQEPRCDECDYAEEEPFRQSKSAQRERKSWLSAASANTMQLESESLLLKLRVHAALKSKAEPRSARIAKTLQLSPNTHTRFRNFECERIGGEECAESRDPLAEIAKKTYKCDYSCGFQVLCENYTKM